MVRPGSLKVARIVDVPLEIAPSDSVRLLLGNPKLGWLNALFASARTCNLTCSQIANVLLSDRLTRLNAGPVSELRPSLPKVPEVGTAKAASLNQ